MTGNSAPECAGRVRRLAAVLGAVVAIAGMALAQSPDQFGGQDRANAASQLIVLGVQRALDSLPPTAAQPVTYEFDPASDAFRRTTRLGPTVLRSAQTMEEGSFGLRLATSYFDLGETFQPIDYLIVFDEPFAGGTVRQQGVAKFGLDVSARVGLINLSAGYGVTKWLEVSGSVPITIVDAQASQIFSTAPEMPDFVVGSEVIDGDLPGAIRDLDRGLQNGDLVLRRESFTNLGVNFNDGTHVGLGRISLGAKAGVWTTERVQLAAMTELFLPSPSSTEFAGPDSTAIFPRLLATVKLTDWLRLHTDVGYGYDFDNAPLRSFTWNTGASVASERMAFDLGIGGAEYDQPIQWTPSVMHGGRAGDIPPSTGYALDDNNTGTTVVDVLVGMKLRLAESTVLSGAVTIPVVSQPFQPAALGTLAVEQYF